MQATSESKVRSAGCEAYQAYAAFTGGKTYDGRDMPTWEGLTERIRGAWEAAAGAARSLAEFDDVEVEAKLQPLPLHTWFGLSYSNYLVMPRALLQSMPGAWQERFTSLLDEGTELCSRAGVTTPVYSVRAVDEATGRYIKDPIPHYRHAGNLLDLDGAR